MTTVRVVIAMIVLAVTSAASQTPARVATTTVDVLPIGPNGEPVIGLSADEFEVVSDGAPVVITSIGSAPAEFAVLLLLDVSISQPLKRNEVHTAMSEGWLPSLRAGDRARMGAIGEPTVFGPWLSGDRVAHLTTARALVDRAPSGPSPIWDATDAAMQLLADEPGAKMVVLVTDGRSAANRLSVDDVLARATAANVAISSVSEGSEQYLPQSGDAAARVRSDVSLRRLADETGGLFVEDGIARRTTSARIDPFGYVRELLNTPNRPGPLLARVMSLMRQRYRIAFAPAAGAGVHTLDVRVSRPGVTVYARRAYAITK